jgi:hypothetical protein
MMKLFPEFNSHLLRPLLLLVLAGAGCGLLAGADPETPVRARPFVACVSAPVAGAANATAPERDNPQCRPSEDEEPRILCVQFTPSAGSADQREKARFWICREIPGDALIDSVAMSESVTLNLQSIIDITYMSI